VRRLNEQDKASNPILAHHLDLTRE
jgi:hypothetical protein